MKRRDFSLAVASLGLLPLAAPVHAQARAPKAGSDYLVLDKPAPVDAPAGKVEVIEFFSYNCPHCAEFEPQLETWLKTLPKDVAFRHVPVPFVGNDVEPKQRMFYALEALGKVDEYQSRVFKAIQADPRSLTGEANIIDWAAKNGFDRTKFTEVFKSFGVVSKARRATQLTEAYKVSGVPALGVAGRWYVDGETARSMTNALQVTDYLIGLARK